MKFKGKFIGDITCRTAIKDLQYNDSLFNCYDKDGFDLTDLEQLYYRSQGFDLYKILNRGMLAIPWLDDDLIHPNIYIDHAVLFMRCDFKDSAREQVQQSLDKDRRLTYLINTRQKWGVDIDINWIDDDLQAYEIVHLEYDTYDYDEAIDIKGNLEEYFRDADVVNMAKQIIKTKTIWQQYNGLKQNDWKAKFFGFSLAEDTKKSY